MKILKRSDLACEMASGQSTEYTVSNESINGIDCICSSCKEGRKTENITICTGAIWRYKKDFFENAVNTVSSCFEKMTYEAARNPKNILTVCLGNRDITVDSLGPEVGERLTPTRHLDSFEKKSGVLVPGVEGQSGFSVKELIKSNLEIWKPDVIITVDSLCSRSVERLLAIVQISSLGIMPGSGVGNHKSEISMSSLKIPVISVGVPTVTQYIDEEMAEKADRVSDFYVSHIETDIGIKAYASLISSSLEKLFLK